MLADSPRFFFLIRRPAHAITVLQNSVFSMERSVANSNFSDSKDHQRRVSDVNCPMHKPLPQTLRPRCWLI